MLVHCYLRRNVVYVPTVARLKTGAYREIEPVVVLSAADTDGLRRAIGDAIKRGNEIIPNPPKNDCHRPSYRNTPAKRRGQRLLDPPRCGRSKQIIQSIKSPDFENILEAIW